MGTFRSKQNGNLTEADKRFFALRESGYDGPIDQDGNQADDPRGILAALRGETDK
jgi:hypothetical protein